MLWAQLASKGGAGVGDVCLQVCCCVLPQVPPCLLLTFSLPQGVQLWKVEVKVLALGVTDLYDSSKGAEGSPPG